MAIFCLERLLVSGSGNFCNGQEVLQHFRDHYSKWGWKQNSCS